MRDTGRSWVCVCVCLCKQGSPVGFGIPQKAAGTLGRIVVRTEPRRAQAFNTCCVPTDPSLSSHTSFDNEQLLRTSPSRDPSPMFPPPFLSPSGTMRSDARHKRLGAISSSRSMKSRVHHFHLMKLTGRLPLASVSIPIRPGTSVHRCY